MKDEYIRRLKRVAQVTIKCLNVITGTNAWAVGIIRYGAGVLDWMKEELKSIGINDHEWEPASEMKCRKIASCKKRRRKSTYQLQRMDECGSAELGQVSL